MFKFIIFKVNYENFTYSVIITSNTLCYFKLALKKYKNVKIMKIKNVKGRDRFDFAKST